MANTAERAQGATPSGVVMTVEKKLAGGARVGKAETLGANPGAPADEYLIPVNAKAVAGIGDLYEGFKVRPNGWSDVATLTFTFSRPVRNPRLHVAGTGGATEDASGNQEEFWTGLRLVGGAPSDPTFTNIAGFPGFKVGDQAIIPANLGGPRREPTCGVVYMCGTAQINGMISTFTMQVRARNVRRIMAAGDAFMWGVFRVTFEEDGSDAPDSYGAASHTVSDLSIGSRATADHSTTVSSFPRRLADDTDDAAGWLPAAGAVDGRRPMQLSVPVKTVRPAVLAGWVDFDRDGKFQNDERASAAVSPGSSQVRLSWPGHEDATAGESWMRLRLADTEAELAAPTGWAASGEVEDHPISLDGAAALKVRHAATPRGAAKAGEGLTLHTAIANTGRTAEPYTLTVDLQDVLDDARHRRVHPAPTSRTDTTLTWQGELKPGDTREFRLRFVTKRKDLGNRQVRTRWSGDGTGACADQPERPACGLTVPVRQR
ncbi:GEVED domain-containing protein [Nonomuraea typhae]|uniref:GEVED domain-containing protein n=1 Tax=Nonomuraea typhae TaxID=2603600 RepID=UPI0012FA7517|nr:GEVED domain-containing protein [Nonomuraea typhae]